MSRTVVDASALLELVRGGAGAGEVQRVLSGGRAHAPATLDAEVLSALRRWVLQG